MRRKRNTINKFLRKMRMKLMVLFLLVVAFLIALIGRLMYIEHTSGDKYEKIVLSAGIRQPDYSLQARRYCGRERNGSGDEP